MLGYPHMEEGVIQWAREGRRNVLTTQLVIHRPRSEVFEFFANAENLAKITPPRLGLRLTSIPPLRMQIGLRLDYRFRMFGAPLGWQSEITAWDPPASFVDEQRRGPYRSWRHEHVFEEQAGETLVRDQVSYQVWQGRAFEALIIRPALRAIFEFRRRAILEIFGETELETFETIAALPLLPNGLTLQAASERQPLLVVFLRHSGCTFCRETLAKLSAERKKIDQARVRLVLVHQSEEQAASEFFGLYGLAAEWRISDPHRRLYRAVGLHRGSVRQLLGLKSWTRGILHGALWRHGVGAVHGDARQMPGTFLFHRGEIINAHIPAVASDEAGFEIEQICSLPPAR